MYLDKQKFDNFGRLVVQFGSQSAFSRALARPNRRCFLSQQKISKTLSDGWLLSFTARLVEHKLELPDRLMDTISFAELEAAGFTVPAFQKMDEVNKRVLSGVLTLLVEARTNGSV